LPHVDYITVHTPLSPETKGIINRDALAKCRKGVFLMNVARGGIIDEAALAEAIKSGHVAGAGLDVFNEEPPKDRTLIVLPQVLCTPHLGASTVEAQTAVSTEAVAALLGYLKRGEIRGAVNLPARDFEVPPELRPYVDLAGRMGRLLSPLCVQGVKKMEITYRGQLADKPTAGLTGTFAATLLQPYFSTNLNVVNVGLIARERGIGVSETKTAAEDVISTSMEALVHVDGETHTIAGTVFRGRSGRIISIDGYPMEMKPAGNMVLLFNRDQPGVIGRVGTIFGRHKVNIAEMTISRLGERALMVLNIDSPAGKPALDELSAEPAVMMIREVALPAEAG
jgi:D-3-phosphoglycerate dehydrogenase